MVLFDHLGYPGDFARHVEVVGAVFGAGLEGGFAILVVGADGGDEDGGGFGEGGEVGGGEAGDFN